MLPCLQYSQHGLDTDGCNRNFDRNSGCIFWVLGRCIIQNFRERDMNWIKKLFRRKPPVVQDQGTVVYREPDGLGRVLEIKVY